MDASWLDFDSYPTHAILYGTPTDDDIGNYTINISVSDDVFYDFTEFTLEVLPPEPIPPDVIDDDPGGNGTGEEDRTTETVIVVAVGASLIIIGIWFFVFTEVGLWILMTTIIVPLYSRLKDKEILNQETRGMIYGYIVANPGAHYFELKKELGISTGALTYHLAVLNDRGFIKTVRNGLYKKFFPYRFKGSKFSKLSPTQTRIIKTLRDNPNVTQSGIVTLSELSQPTVSRNLKDLEIGGIIVSTLDDGKIKYSLFYPHEKQ